MHSFIVANLGNRTTTTRDLRLECAHSARQSASSRINQRLLNDEIHPRYPYYGSRLIRDEIDTQAHTVSRKKVQRLIRQMGLGALYGLLLRRANAGDAGGGEDTSPALPATENPRD